LDCIFASSEGFQKAIISITDGFYDRVDTVGVSTGMPESFLIPRFVDLHAGGFFLRPDEPYAALQARLEHHAAHLVRNGIGFALITVVVDNSGAAESDLAQITALLNLVGAFATARHTGIELRVHLRCELSDDGTTERLATLCDAFAPQIDLISAMDHSPGQGQYKTQDAWQSAYDFLTFDRPGSLEMLAQRRKASAPIHYAERLRGLAKIAGRHRIPFASHDDEDAGRQDLAHRCGSAMSEFPLSEVAASRAKATGRSVLVGAPNIARGNSKFGNVSARRLLELNYVDCVSYDYDPSASVKSWEYICHKFGAQKAIVNRHATLTPFRRPIMTPLGQHG